MSGTISAILRKAFKGPPINREAIERVTGQVRAALGGADDPVIRVSEIACYDPACPGTETVILVMAPGEATRALKIQKALADVTAEDVAALFADGDP